MDGPQEKRLRSLRVSQRSIHRQPPCGICSRDGRQHKSPSCLTRQLRGLGVLCGVYRAVPGGGEDQWFCDPGFRRVCSGREVQGLRYGAVRTLSRTCRRRQRPQHSASSCPSWARSETHRRWARTSPRKEAAPAPREPSCPSWARTRTLLIQSQACCQLHQGAELPNCRDRGAEGDRTPDLCSAIAALSQLSYSPLKPA